MEHGVFPRPEVADRLRKFVLVRLWINDRKPEARSAEWRAMLEKRFGTSAIPFYAALSKDDAVLGTLVYPGGTTAEAFAKTTADFLDAALEKAKAP